LLCALVLPVPAAQAWTWPVDGPVVRPFSFDRAHPYAAGQHRGVDLGAPAGASVLAPTGGVVTFAGTVPSGGKTISIQTPLGYTATLVHLGSIAVARGARVAEGALVGTVGPSGVVDSTEGAFVYFGVRATADDQGYVDPLSFLPPRPAQAAAGAASEPVAAAPAATVASAEAAPVAPAPAALGAAAPAVTPATVTPVANVASEAAVFADEESGATQSVAASSAPPVHLPRGAVHPRAATTRVADLKHRSTIVTRVAAAGSRGSSAHMSSQHVPTTRPGMDARAGAFAAWAPAHTAATRDERHSGRGLAGVAVTAAVLVAFAVALAGCRRRARIMSTVEPEPCLVGAAAKAEDPGRARLAVCVGEATPGPRGRVRGARGHLRAVPPVEGQRRLDGERDGRTWDAGDGGGRSRRRLAA
jgi:hypothetical protein